MLISLLFQPVLIRQNDRSMQSCLVDHFTLAAFCYLLILAPSLHSLTFHLSFIFFNHVHATIFFLLVCRQHDLGSNLLVKQRAVCGSLYSDLMVYVCESMCVHR